MKYMQVDGRYLLETQDCGFHIEIASHLSLKACTVTLIPLHNKVDFLWCDKRGIIAFFSLCKYLVYRVVQMSNGFSLRFPVGC